MNVGVVEEGYVPTEVVDGVDDGPRHSTTWSVDAGPSGRRTKQLRPHQGNVSKKLWHSSTMCSGGVWRGTP
eukprot:3470664-Amphidinium_carterae.1